MNDIPVFKFSYDDKWFNIYAEGRVEFQPVAPSLKGSRIIINRIPTLVATELERNSK
jgi:hypothetical protein